MTATAILSELEAKGVQVQARAGKLRLTPANAVGPELIEYIRAHKSEILAVLTDAVPVAACGSAHCKGCYSIGEGRLLHPPRSSREWSEWLLKWKPRGIAQ